MHAEAYDWFKGELSILPPRRRIVEIGARNINGSLRAVFMRTPVEYVGIDVTDGFNVDVVASGEDYEPPWSPDTVLCAEVLEHTPDDVGRRICQNACRMLQAGGIALLSMATDPRMPHSAVHGMDLEPGEFYRNVTVDHLRDWLDGFARVVWAQHRRGDLYVRAVKGR